MASARLFLTLFRVLWIPYLDADDRFHLVVAGDAAEKPKREPTAYQIFCKEHMKKWNEDNPGRAKEAMSHIAAMWKDAPENPNRGQDVKSRKPKAPKEPKAAKAPKEPKATKAKAAPRAKKAKKDEDEEKEDEAEPSEEADEDDEE
ncbi:hypothetical protein GALMADRAFT_215335 [Galerina marginata CBS 339.88]|uniref:HMG box domain-containing protein n=1 Tax=Galerina marginata (strain CBS 339.88) TaxID=685588 RepID=A0A067SDP6_GALM3|nr:hypothetical protein GALMADRAFT_215335 [Galerina marginata CBS 339.88]